METDPVAIVMLLSTIPYAFYWIIEVEEEPKSSGGKRSRVPFLLMSLLPVAGRA